MCLLPFLRRFASVLRLPVVVLALFTSSNALSAIQAAFYVDPVSGSDTNAGTSIGQAFKTIERSRQAVDAINNNMTDDIVVYLRGGTHRLTSTVAFGPSDSGTNERYVYYKNYEAETPVISGATNLAGGWVIHDAGNNIYKRTGVTGNFRELYVNNRHAIRAVAGLPGIQNGGSPALQRLPRLSRLSACS